MIAEYLKLYLILETSMLKMPLEQFIPAVINGGVTSIQLRDKGATSAEMYATGKKVMELINGRDVLFVVNDRLDIALMLGAKAVHLGVKDIPVSNVRAKYPELILGYSCNDMDDVRAAGVADYIGSGPAFPTSTKADLRGLIGPSGIKELVAAAGKPSVAIGGITGENVDQLSNSGVSGVAVSSAICAAEDPYMAAKMLRDKLEKF
ncbi:thiamine-phosphate pyrophosphorylase [Denitrovibrio acetiphilus DSM 12809]|uniref:Thiamine-phosphate synthase n=1 Tax=Denitrovibrio acetiphilus (strain DSM 12809 / NBRC 114555 / N2460) TaxID=522772 RepID=D4H738_DENA2|nr:thiamine phosphate synthase [Denitrovibrio acetiphilus]ADD69742.1 thiamine-phosphate pyrophosphorylase [Denitrovibrio acetiphilus DSM 12809]